MRMRRWGKCYGGQSEQEDSSGVSGMRGRNAARNIAFKISRRRLLNALIAALIADSALNFSSSSGESQREVDGR